MNRTVIAALALCAAAMAHAQPCPDKSVMYWLAFPPGGESDWVDGAYRGIGVPRSTPPEARKRIAELWAALNADPEMKELAAKSGFELVNVGPDKMDAFMKERIKVYTAVGRQMGLTGGK